MDGIAGSAEKYVRILEQLKTLPNRVKREPTFLEISGFAHFETVISNLLAFFFNTKECHEFGRMFLNALCTAAGETSSVPKTLETHAVDTEVTTRAGKRIDIVVETDDLVVCIENKINAVLYNDLVEYADHITRAYPSSKAVKIALTLRPVCDGPGLQAGFANVTYRELLGQLRRLEEHYLQGANPKYVPLYHDLVETVQRLYGDESLDEALIGFFREHESEIEELVSQHAEIVRIKHERIKRIQGLIGDIGPHVKQWVYRKTCLVHDLYSGSGVNVSVDFNLTLNESVATIWVRSGQASGEKTRFLHELEIATNDNFNVEVEPEQITVWNPDAFHFDADDATIADELGRVLQAVLDDRALR